MSELEPFNSFSSSSPLENPINLEQLLQDQGEGPDEIENLLPALSQLRNWTLPDLKPDQIQHVIARLEPLLLPMLSPVRQALRKQRPGWFYSAWTLSMAQVSVLRLSFWLVSAVIALIGALIVLQQVLPFHQRLIVQALGPLAAYWGTVSAFRGVSAKTLEIELTCPPSLVKITLVRLGLVLGYDILLGSALSLILWSSNGTNFLDLLLYWLMPLLLVVGLALLLAHWLKINQAVTLAYLGWLSLLVLTNFPWLNSSLSLVVNTKFEIWVGLAGLIFLVLALWRLPYSKACWLSLV